MRSDSIFKVDRKKHTTPASIQAGSFPAWMKELQETSDPDKVRSVLYWGFQPLLDVLVDKELKGVTRKDAAHALDVLLSVSQEFLTRYYTDGETDFHPEAIQEIQDTLNAMEAVYFHRKDRNIGLYGDHCLPKNIQAFLKSALKAIDKSVIPEPDYIVGCACGSSELVLPLAKILDVPFDFIRRSKRRGDPDPVVLPEHNERIKERAKGKSVLVIEDYVCSGGTIHSVMKKMQSFKPETVYGASMCRNLSDSLMSELKQLSKGDDFYAFSGK